MNGIDPLSLWRRSSCAGAQPDQDPEEKTTHVRPVGNATGSHRVGD
jgi:hypothetical protein